MNNVNDSSPETKGDQPAVAISRALTLFLMALMGSFGIAISVVVSIEVSRALSEVQDNAFELEMKGLTNEIDLYLDDRCSALTDYAKFPIVGQTLLQPEHNHDAYHDFVSTLHLLGEQPQLTLFNDKGETLHQTRVTPVINDNEIQPWRNRSWDGSEAKYIGIAQALDGRHYWQLVAPVLHGDSVSGYLMATLPLDTLSEKGMLKEQMEHSHAKLLYNGEVIYSAKDLPENYTHETRELPIAAQGASLRYHLDRSVLAELRASLIIKIILTLLAITVLGWLVGSAVTRRFFVSPMTQLRAISAAIIDKTQDRIPVDYRILELRMLANDFNRMAEIIQSREDALESVRRELEQRVEDRTKELSIANASLQAEVQERVQVEQELRSNQESTAYANEKLNTYAQEIERKNLELDIALQRAQDATHAKSEFLANMSHEIRTPMNGVIGMTNLLLDTPLNQEQREYAETVSRSGKSLLAIINDILDFSKIEAGKLELEIIDFDLRHCVEDAVDLLSTNAEDKNIELSAIINHDVPTLVRGDSGRIRQILLNLISNAVKFTSKGGVTIETSLVESDAQSATMTIAVKDTGIGIPSDRLDRLFKSFSQVDASTTREHGGTGLGLAISKRLVELMGGSVSVESIEGEGSTFSCTLTFPRQQDTKTNAFPLATKLEGLPVLVISADSMCRLSIYEQLACWGCEMDEASGTEEAWQLIDNKSRTPYRVVFIDLNLSQEGVLSFADKLSTRPTNEQPYSILMAPIRQREKNAQALEKGLRDFIAKPVKQASLYNALTKAIGETKSERPSQVIKDKSKTRRIWRRRSEKQRQSTGRSHIPRVLIVEDNITNQRVATLLLERMGLRTDVAANGKEALAAISNITYDLVLMDCHMPVLDGYQATEAIREQERASEASHRLPVIAMTANALKSDREKCLAAGMDEYISKPVQASALEEMLERFLDNETVETHLIEEDAIEKEGSAMSNQQSIIDVERLAEMSGGDREIDRELINLYLDDNTSRLDILREAIAKADAETLHHAAHTMKGASANVGADAVQELASQLEIIGTKGSVEGAQEIYDILTGTFEQTRTAFHAYLAS